MKKHLVRKIITILLAFSILSMMKNAVHANEKEQVSLLKSKEESYIIYVEKNLNTEFLFGFSEEKEIVEEDLIFLSSGLDSDGYNVAYMSKDLADTFENGQVYMWLKNGEELIKYDINLNQAVTTEEIVFVNSTTKRIDVKITESEKTSKDVEGIKVSYSQGKVGITEKENNFSYYIEKVSDEQTTSFLKLAEKIISNKEMSNYESISFARKFVDEYTNMLESIENWEKVPTNKEILQPQESKKGDTYLVWIKNNQTKEHDVQILVCNDEYTDIEKEEAKEVIIYETTKLPITYDSTIILIVSLGVIVLLLIILIMIKRKIKTKEIKKN